MPYRLPPSKSPYDETIRELKSDLYDARRTVIDLMPEDFKRIVDDYYTCESRSDLSEWRRNLVAAALQRAKLLPESPFYPEKRAYCPLCGAGSSSPYDKGFKFPGGLERHLEGGGNAHRCSVMNIIWKYALDQIRETVDQHEQMKQHREQTAKSTRRATEILWRVDQDEPKLIDEGLWLSIDGVRDEESLAFAEERLAQLGFKCSLKGKVKSYTQETEDFIVYADPRTRKHIEFRIFSKRKKPKRLFGSAHGSFKLQDGWKNDLPKKYKAMLDEALSRL